MAIFLNLNPILFVLTSIMQFQALYHALPMKYVTVAKLQKQLDGEASQTTVRKLIDKMTRDGYLEAKGNRRLGKLPKQKIKLWSSYLSFILCCHRQACNSFQSI